MGESVEARYYHVIIIIMKKFGKKYRQKKELLEKKEFFGLSEAVKLVKDTAATKFDATLEVHINLNCDPKHADQIVRTTIVLPHGSGKSPRIAAFVTEDKMKAAKAAGADIVGEDDLIENISKGMIDFDLAVAIPDVMKKLGKIAKILGQKRLMPSPKAGTVTTNFEQVIKEFKLGKIELRTDKQGQIHSIFGKASFDENNLLENIKALIKAVLDAKPSGVKGAFIKTISLASSMGPGISLDLTETLKEVNS